MNLAQALDAALTRRYPPLTVDIKSPATSKRGATARMRAIEKHFTREGDRAGAATKRVAAALGITPRTWQRWKAGTRTPNATILEGAHKRLIGLPRMIRRMSPKGTPPPSSVTVKAIIVWNGYRNRTELRSTTLGGMRHVMAKVIEAWTARGPERAAKVFQEGAAIVHNTAKIEFEGDEVEVSFPW
jgi:hypothetical protein